MKIFLLILCLFAQRWARIARSAVKLAAKSDKVGNLESAAKSVTEEATSNAARRQVMRLAGIPTSQMPFQVTENASGRQYQYTIRTKEGMKIYSVQRQSLDASHPGLIHWEAGKVREDEEGKIVWTKWNAPRLDNTKFKVEVKAAD